MALDSQSFKAMVETITEKRYVNNITTTTTQPS
jgi:hypothetical protein